MDKNIGALFENSRIWLLKNKDVLNVRVMMYMLTMIFPTEFHIDFAGTVQNLFRVEQDGNADFAFLSDLDITEEIL